MPSSIIRGSNVTLFSQRGLYYAKQAETKCKENIKITRDYLKGRTSSEESD